MYYNRNAVVYRLLAEIKSQKYRIEQNWLHILLNRRVTPIHRFNIYCKDNSIISNGQISSIIMNFINFQSVWKMSSKFYSSQSHLTQSDQHYPSNDYKSHA